VSKTKDGIVLFADLPGLVDQQINKYQGSQMQICLPELSKEIEDDANDAGRRRTTWLTLAAPGLAAAAGRR